MHDHMGGTEARVIRVFCQKYCWCGVLDCYFAAAEHLSYLDETTCSLRKIILPTRFVGLYVSAKFNWLR
jgi:hypothetical protein